MKGDFNINMDSKRAIRQFNEIKKLGKELRLAADGWDADWKILIATIMSARTTDKKTIPVAEELYSKYGNIEKLSAAKLSDVEKIIRPVNFYKTKAKNVINCAKEIVEKYGGKVPHDFSLLVELPGVGRKTANVFLAEKGHGRIGVDTHVSFVSRKMGWTKNIEQEKVEKDLEKLFSKKMWGDINWVLVRFGQTYPNRKVKNEILDRIKKIK
jgi:endonuclease-3